MRLLRRLLFRLRFGQPRPCPDDECVRATPEEHGMEPIMELTVELTEAERKELGWMLHRHRDESRMGRMNSDQCFSEAAELVACIKAEAVQAERERIAREIESQYLGPDFGRQHDGSEAPDAALRHAFDEGLEYAARIAWGEGR